MLVEGVPHPDWQKEQVKANAATNTKTLGGKKINPKNPFSSQGLKLRLWSHPQLRQKEKHSLGFMKNAA